jgi:hypothetical protein
VVPAQRDEGFAGIGPILHLFEGDVVFRLTAGAL